MAIHKKVRHHSNMTSDAALPVFSYDPAKLAPVIVSLWNNPLRVLDRDHQGNPTPGAVTDATNAINGAGFDLARAVIITEAEHDAHYYLQDDKEVVFVLPNQSRVANNPTHLLDTAKLLMASTPNGI